MTQMKKCAKAVVAFLAGGLTTLSAQLQNGASRQEILRSAIAGLVTAIVVWATPNSN